jgi:hypothetical protein
MLRTRDNEIELLKKQELVKYSSNSIKCSCSLKGLETDIITWRAYGERTYI